jgi:hypothetical protein
MLSDQYGVVWGRSLQLSRAQPRSRDALQPSFASDYVPLFWTEGFGPAGELDRAIIARSVEVKVALYGGRVFVIALTDNEPEKEALYFIEEKGLKVLELVYATDPRMRVDSMCRHIELW